MNTQQRQELEKQLAGILDNAKATTGAEHAIVMVYHPGHGLTVDTDLDDDDLLSAINCVRTATPLERDAPIGTKATDDLEPDREPEEACRQFIQSMQSFLGHSSVQYLSAVVLQSQKLAFLCGGDRKQAAATALPVLLAEQAGAAQCLTINDQHRHQMVGIVLQLLPDLCGFESLGLIATPGLADQSCTVFVSANSAEAAEKVPETIQRMARSKPVDIRVENPDGYDTAGLVSKFCTPDPGAN
ncbi:hypothetical protein KOR42_39900 [Thalassoglobus neptunius]|uniref:Uncharacterized protein n=2 Tax=Thalassoglobus neptunius TaxID=1938619 RepID=A0A5C5WC21_9PLAN|nr:hypothetical protein KOR42_39900 [Thalassoglobus neptunius]